MKIKLAKKEIIHFIGIGGIGMSGLSLIMKGKGFNVQGSDILNNKNIERLRKEKIKIFLDQTKKNLKEFYDLNNVENEIFNFEKNFIHLINKSNICITRAGATSLAEISIMNKPFIAIPLPSAKDDHQMKNAKFYEKAECCWVLNQKILDKVKLTEILLSILNDKSDYINKKINLKKLNYQNSWNSVNESINKIINEN